MPQRELRIVVQRMNTLKEIFNKHVAEQGGFDLEASLRANRFVTKENPQAVSHTIPGELRSILERLLDPHRLASFGLIHGDGAIYSPERNDKVLVSKKDVDCLRQVIALLRAGTQVKV